jgi:hypothetical protein
MSGRDAAAAVGLWALFNAALAVMLLLFGTTPVQQGAWWLAVAALLAIVVLALRAAEPRVRRIPEASGGAVVLALAIAMLALGAGLGLWAALIGVELIVVAAVLLARERGR